MKARHWIAALVLLVAAQRGAANYYTGNDIMRLCENTGPSESGANLAKNNQCLSYLFGISDAFATLQRMGFKPVVCLPLGTEGEQLRRVFLRFMRQRPELWQYPATLMALEAYNNTWPCEK